MKEQCLSSSGSAPYRNVPARMTLAAVSSPKNGEGQTEPRRDFGQCRRMAERIRAIQQRWRFCTECGERPPPHEKISHQCFAAGNELIGQDIPRTSFDPLLLQKLLDLRPSLGTHRQIIIEYDGLAIEKERLALTRRV